MPDCSLMKEVHLKRKKRIISVSLSTWYGSISSSGKEREKKRKKLSENNYWNLQMRKSRGRKKKRHNALVHCSVKPISLGHVSSVDFLFCFIRYLRRKKNPTEPQNIMQLFWFSEINSNYILTCNWYMSSLFLVSSLSASKQFSEEVGDQHKFHVKSFYMTDSFE